MDFEGLQRTEDGGVSAQVLIGAQRDVVVSELGLKYTENNRRGSVYHFGVSNTALVAANAIATGLTASAQPVLGLYNPSTSLYTLEIIAACVQTSTVAATAVSPGGFMWLASVGNTAVSTGSTPWNGKTLAQAGSAAKVFSVGTALTGLTNNLAAIRSCFFNSINAAGPGTAIHQPTTPAWEFVDGQFSVPPGGVLAIMNQVATTTISVSTGIIWREVLTTQY